MLRISRDCDCGLGRCLEQVHAFSAPVARSGNFVAGKSAMTRTMRMISEIDQRIDALVAKLFNVDETLLSVSADVAENDV